MVSQQDCVCGTILIRMYVLYLNILTHYLSLSLSLAPSLSPSLPLSVALHAHSWSLTPSPLPSLSFSTPHGQPTLLNCHGTTSAEVGDGRASHGRQQSGGLRWGGRGGEGGEDSADLFAVLERRIAQAKQESENLAYSDFVSWI